MLLKIILTTGMETIWNYKYRGYTMKMVKQQIHLIGYTTAVLCIICFITGYTYPVFAETGYVSNMLLLTVREGPGNNFKVLKTLKSNDPVEIIDKQNNYYKIKTNDGTKGWVEQQYITDKIPQSLITADRRQKISRLEKDNKALAYSNTAMQKNIKNMETEFKTKITELNDSLQKTIAEKNQIKSALNQEISKYDSLINATGKGSLKVIKENMALKQKNKVLADKIEKLTENNEDGLKTGMIQWFLAGAGVLFAGWLIGRSIKSNKRSSGGLLG